MSRMTLFRRLVVILAVLTMSFSLPGLAGPQKMTKCWFIEEQNKLMGDNQIYASPQAVKIVFFNKKWIDIARAPDWELYVFSPSSKYYWHTPLSKWRGTALLQSASIIDRNVKPNKTKEVQKILSFNATKYATIGKDPTTHETEAEEYWVTKEIILPKEIIHIICTNAGIPDTDGFPLRVMVTRVRVAHGLTVLNTASAKMTTVPENFFNLPTGYKYSESPERVMSGGVMKLLEEVLTE
jgi:hypothetical protein